VFLPSQSSGAKLQGQFPNTPSAQGSAGTRSLSYTLTVVTLRGLYVGTGTCDGDSQDAEHFNHAIHDWANGETPMAFVCSASGRGERVHLGSDTVPGYRLRLIDLYVASPLVSLSLSRC